MKLGHWCSDLKVGREGLLRDCENRWIVCSSTPPTITWPDSSWGRDIVVTSKCSWLVLSPPLTLTHCFSNCHKNKLVCEIMKGGGWQLLPSAPHGHKSHPFFALLSVVFIISRRCIAGIGLDWWRVSPEPGTMFIFYIFSEYICDTNINECTRGCKLALQQTWWMRWINILKYFV